MRKVAAAQNVSRMCFVCGLENPGGLSARFFETDDGSLIGEFSPCEHHQGYPGRLHGGVATTILDETMGRAISISDPSAWGVTVDLAVRFRRPVPLDSPVRAVARITADRGRIFEGEGEIVLADGTVAVSATGRYLRQDITKIAQGDFDQEWFSDPRDLPDAIDI
ncbi:MAG: PaaI family thioesterase [Coriobacteriia bacterium]|nr:PaaI family thioesterase [Coriobacteriia bacterium]